jgi:hypothetical protein
MQEILALHDDSAPKDGYSGTKLEEIFLKLTSNNN